MRGAVAAGARGTTDAGAWALARGGNSADALVAGVAASFVCEFMLTSPGAGGIAVVHEPGGRVRAFDCFAAMPGLELAEGKRPRDLDFAPVRLAFEGTAPTFHVGRASVAVPGVIAGLATIHQRYGRLPFGDLLAPAIRLAREGFALAEAQRYIARVLQPMLTHTDEMAALVGGRDTFLSNADAMTLEPTAALLERLRDEGARSLYTGAAATAICDDQRARGGLLRERDLAEYAVLDLEPNAIRLDGWTVYTPPLPSFGGTMVAAILSLWREIDRACGHATPGTAGAIHRWAVAIEAVNQARVALGNAGDDASSADIVRGMLDRLVEPACAAIRSGSAWRAVPPMRPRGNTTHFSAVDRDGLAVAFTSSPGEGAGYLVPGLGMMMNNMLGEEDLNPGGFHLHRPGSRLPTMMSPGVAVRHAGAGDSTIAFGSGGSTRIRSAISQFIARLVHDGMDLDEAIESERVHFEEGELHLEGRRPPEVLDAMRAMGYRVREWQTRNPYFGGVHAVWLDGGGGFRAHGDSRRGGVAVIVE